MCYLVKCADYFVVHLLYSLFFVCLVCMLLKKIQESPILIMILPIYSFHSVNYISKYVLLPFLNFDVYIFIEGASHYNHENSLFNSVSVQFSSVQFSCSVVSDSLQPHGLQHARPPCPSPTPRVYPNSCPLSQWCHPTISSSVIPFSFCPQSFSASGSFQMSQLFASDG